jgi:hypothetical protein
MRFVGRLLAVLALVSMAVLPLAAHVDRATLNGTVSDASGAVIPGAKVEAVAPATGLRRTTTTGPFGAYNIAEAFNLFNHAILNAPAASISTPATFGKITGSSNPRKIQLMFRVEF